MVAAQAASTFFVIPGGPQENTPTTTKDGEQMWSVRVDLTNLGHKEMLFLKAIKEAVEVWSAKVSYRTQASEQTLARNLLEVTLTNVLEETQK